MEKISEEAKVEEEKAAPQKVVNIPLDYQLQDLITTYPFIDKFKQSGFIIFECSVNSYWNILMAENAPCPFLKFWKDEGITINQTATSWIHGGDLPPGTNIDHASNLDRSSILMSRLLDADAIQPMMKVHL